MARRLAGRYVLGDQIGAGGTARVHRADDERLGRRVAVKLLDSSLVASADPAGRDRFLSEGRTTAAFNHPHAVTVFDAGEDDGDLFLVMELVEGESLADRLARVGPMPIAEVVDITRPLLSVLSAAHAAGIVHRDVKPANVLLGRVDDPSAGSVGTVKLADFGIAKRFDDLDGSVTATGVVVGTPRYLAPEQAVGTAVSPATDVYALGTVVYEMLTGRAPVEADSMVAAALVQQSQPAPDVRTLRPEVPTSLAELVARALERSPDDRFASASEMHAALEDAWAPGASSPQAGVPTQLLGAVLPGAATGVRSGDTQVHPAAPLPHLPSPPGQAAQQVPSDPGSDDRDGGTGAHVGDPESSGRTAAVLVLVLALVVAVAAVAVATSRGGGGELIADVSAEAEAEGDAAEVSDTGPAATEPEPPPTDPPPTEPPPTEPSPTEPAPTEPPEEIIPGFPVTDDLGVFLAQVERDPFLVGEEGEELAEDLREVLEERGGKQRKEARELREELAEWAEDGEIHPAIAAALDDLLAPLAER